jgi:hypothetical protein
VAFAHDKRFIAVPIDLADIEAVLALFPVRPSSDARD